MAKKKTTRFDSAVHLDSDEAISAYALGQVTRARGMTEIANEAGLSRESLYKALSADGNTEFGTVLKVMRALGLKLSVGPSAGH